MHHHVGHLIADRYRITKPAPPGDGTTGFLATDERQTTEPTVLVLPYVLPEVLTPEDSAHPYGPGIDREPRGAVKTAADIVRVVTGLPEHKHLGVVLDAAADGDRVWLVQERINRGEPLSRTLAGGPIDPHRAAEIAHDLLRGLRHLHQLGWHHGNITPQTVWLDFSGNAILTGLDQAVLDDLICGISRSMPQPPAPPPEVTGPARSTQLRPAATVPPVVVRPGAVGGIAGGVRADASRSASAGPRAVTPRRRPHTEAAPPGPAVPSASPPLTPLEAERARQLRMITVGYVVERWAPEQAFLLSEATPVLPPVGAPTDLWALGALLFRAVTGQPPYPEGEDTAELLDMVRSEPPAYAEDTGALRPLIEKLLCSDPLKRPSAEELLRWIATISRDAPEPPEPTTGAPAREPVPAPEAGTSLVLRFRGHLVRRGRVAVTPSRPVRRRARHRRPGARPRIPRRPASLVALTAALTALGFIVYTSTQAPGPDQTPADGRRLPPPPPSVAGPSPDGQPVVRDPAGFSIAIAPDASRHATARTVEYRHQGIIVTVVPGHDTLRPGESLLGYQGREPELAVVRADPASTASGLRLTTVGQSSTTAEGTYRFRPPGGPPTYLRNRVTSLDGKLQILLVSGPGARHEQIDAAYLQAAGSYKLHPERQPGGTVPPPAGRAPRGRRHEPRARSEAAEGVGSARSHRVRAVPFDESVSASISAALHAESASFGSRPRPPPSADTDDRPPARQVPTGFSNSP
ncbi:hypothetical protein ACFVV7_27175 [Streptomyces globisporus]|uniref:hypothetical protein n=1 Tax=Streptomyces globisporus TaxID=1908 RepID=UPI0036DF6E11